MAHGRGWRSYFYCAVLVEAVSIAAAIYFADRLGWEDAFISLGLLQLASLYGFVYARKIAAAAFWQGVFVLAVGYEAWSAYDAISSLDSEPLALVVAAFALTYAVQLPLWYANFMYGFRAKALWRAAPAPNGHGLPLG